MTSALKVAGSTACAVAEPHAKYTGETRFPLIIQNTHRYFFYIAGIISVINTYDAIIAFHSPSGFGFGLGNVILVVNVVMLWVYTLSCHSCRHIVGGRLKHFSKHPARYWMWTQISRLANDDFFKSGFGHKNVQGQLTNLNRYQGRILKA